MLLYLPRGSEESLPCIKRESQGFVVGFRVPVKHNNEHAIPLKLHEYIFIQEVQTAQY